MGWECPPVSALGWFLHSAAMKLELASLPRDMSPP